MKKISITNLEKARNNPSKFGKSLLDDTISSGAFGTIPKSMKWHGAVIEYHNTNDLSKAISKLENSFSKRSDSPKNRNELKKLIIALDNYVNEYTTNGFIHFDKRVNIDIQLSPKIKLSGWIWLLNMKSTGGYAGYIISKNIGNHDWMLDLRFPIMQEYIANTLYGCLINEVDVGVIDYTTGNHFTTSYSQEEIHKALNKLNEISSTINNMLE